VSRTIILIVAALFVVRPASAQTTAPSDQTEEGGRRWQPIGPAPVDQAGAGTRGYALPPETGAVADPGAGQLSVQTVVANNFYHEQTDSFVITQRYETHTLALGYRRGVRLGAFPRIEFGGQVQFVESDGGFLNGFISGFERMAASLTGQQSAENQLRTNTALLPPLGTFITKDSRSIYAASGGGSGFGDVSLVAKAQLRDPIDDPGAARVAARIGVNLAGASSFTAGNFAGIGLSLDKPIATWAAFHGDLRATMNFERQSAWNLPLKAGSVGFSTGLELKLTRQNSAIVQIDGNTSPYVANGTTAFDEGYGDITIGVGHRSASGRVLTHIYLRENMDLPFRVRWNLDPDLSLGVRTTIRIGR
jgi:hypothetical protein